MNARIAHRLVPLLAALAVVVPAAGANAATDGAGRLVGTPTRIAQGSEVEFVLVVRRSGIRCSLTIRYADGNRQQLGSKVAKQRRATWHFVVPQNAAPGQATASASCGRYGTTTKNFFVVGSVIPVRIDVVNQGYSVRVQRSGGSTVSYGVVLRNTSQSLDALDLSVLVNFVDASNNLIGSASSRLASIAAGQDYAHGGMLSFPGAAPVDRLEVVVQVGGRAPHALRMPALANIRVAPSPFEAGWVGSVEGEMINDEAAWTLQNARFSAVVFDAGGNVIGGGSGSSIASLPPGAREFIKLQSGFNAIPMSSAFSALVSVEPRWVPTG